MQKINLFLLVVAIGLGRAGANAEDAPVPAADNQVPEATTYQLRNVKYQELLRPRDASSTDGTPIVLYPAQPWKCMTWRLQPAGASAFHLKNLFTGKTISTGARTSAPQLDVAQLPLAKDGGESTVWRFIPLADGNYEIAEGKTGKALTAIKNAGETAAKIVAEAWRNDDGQKWTLEKMDPKQLTM